MSSCQCGRPANHPGLCARRCSIPGCGKAHLSSGYCSAHYMRWRRNGDPVAGKSSAQALHIEDVEWMAETGEGLEGAARRLDRSVTSLQRALERADRYDLVSRLKSNRTAVSA